MSFWKIDYYLFCIYSYFLYYSKHKLAKTYQIVFPSFYQLENNSKESLNSLYKVRICSARTRGWVLALLCMVTCNEVLNQNVLFIEVSQADAISLYLGSFQLY